MSGSPDSASSRSTCSLVVVVGGAQVRGKTWTKKGAHGVGGVSGCVGIHACMHAYKRITLISSRLWSRKSLLLRMILRHTSSGGCRCC